MNFAPAVRRPVRQLAYYQMHVPFEHVRVWAAQSVVFAQFPVASHVWTTLPVVEHCD